MYVDLCIAALVDPNYEFTEEDLKTIFGIQLPLLSAIDYNNINKSQKIILLKFNNGTSRHACLACGKGYRATINFWNPSDGNIVTNTSVTIQRMWKGYNLLNCYKI